MKIDQIQINNYATEFYVKYDNILLEFKNIKKMHISQPNISESYQTKLLIGTYNHIIFHNQNDVKFWTIKIAKESLMESS